MRVKICGITRAGDALLAAALGATDLGFVFWPGSPRVVPIDVARTIRSALPPHVSTVGVFVDQPIEDVRRIAERVQLSTVQLHGSESVTYVRALRHPVIKAVPVTPRFTVESLDAFSADVTILLDAHDAVRRGGTGRTIDWSLAASAAARRRVFLSGGLNPGNVRDALTRVRPYAVDLSSGVESAPGIKDPVKLRALFDVISSMPDLTAVAEVRASLATPRRRRAVGRAKGGIDTHD